MKPYSEDTAKMIDKEVKAIVDAAYEKTKQLLVSKMDKLEELAVCLLEKEVIDKKQIEEILGQRPGSNGNGSAQKTENSNGEEAVVETHTGE